MSDLSMWKERREEEKRERLSKRWNQRETEIKRKKREWRRVKGHNMRQCSRRERGRMGNCKIWNSPGSACSVHCWPHTLKCTPDHNMHVQKQHMHPVCFTSKCNIKVSTHSPAQCVVPESLSPWLCHEERRNSPLVDAVQVQTQNHTYFILLTVTV